ncbi:PAS domain-containing sensor histidine kinase [Hymenobacter rubripertinctus]|uniref:histidine kinase n=1 Tax=Hymenobacter rubripertinctus TaxID=2029981 RepID=A0A418QQE3_9BACT|nr:PAS domain-containing protein [Hymenobacter rubripertinctus]RIY07260.1 PAS domain S-box protein [Hymenobacter rubripertinctus]
MSLSECPSSNHLLTSKTEAVLVLSSEGEIRQVSPALTRLLSQPADTLLGRYLTDVLPPAEEERVRPLVARAAAGEVVCYQGLLPGPPQLSECQVALLPLLTDNRIAGVYALVCSRGGGLRPADQALLVREQQLSVIFDSITDITFVLDVEPEGRYRFTFANRAFQKTTGLRLEKVIGSYVHDIIPEPSLSLVLRKYEKAVRTCQPVIWQETSDYPTGQLTGEVTITPVLDEAGECRQLVGIVHDLTRQKKIEEDLRLSNERFQYAIKATTDALYDWDVAADTLYWGEGYEMLFGYGPQENPEPFSQWAEHVLPAEKQRVVGGLRYMAYETTDWHWQEEYRFRRADGSWAWVYDRGYILRDEHGRPVRMIGAMQDISERREAQERQRLMSERLFRQNSDLQQFTYIVSHNLRAPLANALGFADLLARVAPGSDVFTTSLQNLHTSLRQLDGVLTDVNTVLSVRDQQGGYRAEPVALAAVCGQALQGVLPLLKACGGELRYEIPEDLRLPGKRAYFHSIFHNLVSNAIKYRSDERPLLIEVEATTDADGATTIRVRDNGRGFDLAAAGDAVFQLYQRFHSDKKGRGIGLFLVKTHVESMGGRVSVESREGAGTQFMLYFSSHGHENVPD